VRVIGTKVGRFLVEGQLGSGGMGVVYAAHDRELDRRIALKVLKGAVDEEQRLRLMREGQAMARVTHENVITVHEVGIEGSIVFLAQELLDGGTLREWLETKHTQAEILAKFVAAGRGLAAAHRAGLVHRDFKPDNVLLGKDGRVRVSDFGLARSLVSVDVMTETVPGGSPIDPLGQTSKTEVDLANPMMTMTRTGAVMGTPLYMSPEQHLGKNADARSDQFSFCVALYQALYGDVPFAGKTAPALADAVIDGRMQPPPKSASVPSRIRKILLRGLATNPADRYPTMDALIADLTFEPGKRRRRVAIIATVLALSAAGVAGGYALRDKTGASDKVPARRTVAVLGFKNLAADPSIDWISQGMSQLLAAQLATDDVRVTPAEEAFRARSDLKLSVGQELGAKTLDKLRDRLDADVVVVGSYVKSGDQLTLIAVVQDIPRNKTSRVEIKGSTTDLPALAEKAGVEIRKALGITSIAAAKKTFAVLPQDANATREFIEGTEALRAYDYREAKRHLLAAVKADADFAPGHLALAQAYAGLFDADAAHASAKRALETAKALPIDQQLAVARDANVVLDDVPHATEAAQRLFALHPDSLEDGLALARLQSSEQTIAALRKLSAEDPRIDLVEAASAEPARALELARRATASARTKNSLAVLAQARYREGEALSALGQLAAAQGAFEEARKTYQSLGDQRSMLDTMEAQAEVALALGQLSSASQTYDAVAALRRKAGQSDDAALAGVAYALALRGDIQGAEQRLGKTEAPHVAALIAWAKGDTDAALKQLAKCDNTLRCLQLMARIQTQLGDSAGARATLEQAKDDESALILASLDLDDAATDDDTVATRVIETVTPIQQAALTNGAARLEAHAWIVLARAQLAKGESQKALEAINHVAKQEEVRLEVERAVTEALTYKELSDPSSAREKLDAVKAIADKQGNLALQLEVRLALTRLLPPDEAKLELENIVREAKAQNLGRIAKRAETLAQP
jgi:tetratricopeptide (TPR) repeat protein/TolB-like protein